MRAGGNAVDAAVAAAAASFSAEPLLASAGGAGLMTVALPGQDPAVLDFFSAAPGLGAGPPNGPTDFISIEIDFGPATQTFHIGRGSAAPPLSLPGLAEASRRYGKLPLSDVVAPAVEMARSGVPTSEVSAMTFRLLWSIVSRDADARPLLAPGGSPPNVGDRLPNPEMAAMLETFGREGLVPKVMREGLLEGFGQQRGGLLTQGDLDAEQVHICEPHRIPLGDWEILTSPQVGGILVGGIVAQLGADDRDAAEAREVVRMARASREAHGRRAALTVPGSTTHISVIDAEGGAASVTLTNGEGCGHLIPGTGVQLNNFLGEEDLNPHGFHQHPPGSKLPTMVAPTIALRAGRPALVLGSGGSNRIRSSVGTVLHRVAACGDPVEDAVLAPRVHAESDDVWIEREGLDDPDGCVRALGEVFDRVHPFPKRAFFFGGVHAVYATPDGELSGIGDPRRGGATERV